MSSGVRLADSSALDMPGAIATETETDDQPEAAGAGDIAPDETLTDARAASGSTAGGLESTPVSTAGPDRAPVRPRTPAVLDGEIPDDYVAPQTRNANAAVSSRTARVSGGGVRAAAGGALNVARRPEAIEGVPGAGAFAVPPLGPDEASVAKVLSRYAVEQLTRQDVQFERCDISVRGTVASALCRDRAREADAAAPAGGEPAPRQWRFTLRRTGVLWKVQTAEARNSN
jgi:hypothetical protein